MSLGRDSSIRRRLSYTNVQNFEGSMTPRCRLVLKVHGQKNIRLITSGSLRILFSNYKILPLQDLLDFDCTSIVIIAAHVELIHCLGNIASDPIIYMYDGTAASPFCDKVNASKLQTFSVRPENSYLGWANLQTLQHWQ